MKNKFLLKSILAGGIGLAAAAYADAQGLENVIVEKYYVSDANDATDTDGGSLAVGSVTYRIYIDLLPGFELQTMYGSPTHELRFETTTSFFNNEDRGAVSAKDIPDNQLGNNTVLLDSYLTMGAGSDGLWGVLKANDTNGAIANVDGFLQNNNAQAGIPLTIADGLIPGPGVPPVVTFVPGESIFSGFDNVNAGPVVSTSNGAWAILGGTMGPTAANQILIAQITTDGTFSFELNLRVGGPNGTFTDYVAKNATGNELVSEGLTFTSVAICNVDGGVIATTASTSFCVATGSSKILPVSLTGAVGPNSIWALTQLNGDVVATRFGNANFNLDIYAPGDYRIFHMSYDDDVQLSGITNGSQLSGCFDLSNPITVRLRPQPNGGTISTSSATTFCVTDGAIDVVTVSITGQTGEFSRFALVSIPGNVVVSSQPSNVFNLSNIAPGNYRIFHLSFQAGVSLAGVISGSDLEGCFSVSNPISITAQSCGAALLTSSPNPTSGISNVTFSLPEEGLSTLEVYDMSGRIVATLFNQVAQKDVEYRMEFDGLALPNGVYIYRLTSGSDVMIEKFMIAK